MLFYDIEQAAMQTAATPADAQIAKRLIAAQFGEAAGAEIYAGEKIPNGHELQLLLWLLLATCCPSACLWRRCLR